MSGHLEMDETFIGGKLKNMHKNKRPVGTGVSGKAVGSMAKTIVVGMLERNGRVKAEVVADRTTDVLQGMMRKNIDESATLITDEWKAYGIPILLMRLSTMPMNASGAKFTPMESKTSGHY
jgi:hypothetical protein